MSIISYDLVKLYERTFGSKPYKVPADDKPEATVDGFDPLPKNQYKQEGKTTLTSEKGYNLMQTLVQREIWLPTKLKELNGKTLHEYFLPFSAIKVSAKKNIVKTTMAERQGSVKELYSIDDYAISIKGFFIDIEKRLWPEKDLLALKEVFESNAPISIDNALVNAVIGVDTKVVVVSFELPEVEGGRKHVRPFNIQLESDSIFTLEV